MINWIPFDPENPPEKNKEFLVWSEDESYGMNLPWLARFNGVYWGNSQSDGLIKDVTFYAEINSPYLPGEG